jgi:predicted  nucleic acid-binding Zn-ribbon protein
MAEIKRFNAYREAAQNLKDQIKYFEDQFDRACKTIEGLNKQPLKRTGEETKMIDMLGITTYKARKAAEKINQSIDSYNKAVEEYQKTEGTNIVSKIEPELKFSIETQKYKALRTEVKLEKLCNEYNDLKVRISLIMT